LAQKQKTLRVEGFENGAGDATRTRDIFLGKEVLYQLSYTRNWCEEELRKTRGF
jgi:hypothetical protein